MLGKLLFAITLAITPLTVAPAAHANPAFDACDNQYKADGNWSAFTTCMKKATEVRICPDGQHRVWNGVTEQFVCMPNGVFDQNGS